MSHKVRGAQDRGATTIDTTASSSHESSKLSVLASVGDKLQLSRPLPSRASRVRRPSPWPPSSVVGPGSWQVRPLPLPGTPPPLAVWGFPESARGTAVEHTPGRGGRRSKPEETIEQQRFVGLVSTMWVVHKPPTLSPCPPLTANVVAPTRSPAAVTRSAAVKKAAQSWPRPRNQRQWWGGTRRCCQFDPCTGDPLGNGQLVGLRQRAPS